MESGKDMTNLRNILFIEDMDEKPRYFQVSGLFDKRRLI
jgi:hypothetical protein